jgi:hypothetical protein
MHLHIRSSVIVKVIDQFHIGFVQPENHTPVAIYHHRQKPGLLASKAMQEQAGATQVGSPPRDSAG